MSIIENWGKVEDKQRKDKFVSELEDELDLDLDRVIDKKGDSKFHDRTKKIKYEIPEEQKQTGLEMDNAYKREQRLRNNPDLYDINDYSQILYRLPIREEVMDKIFKDLTSNK